jgi:hypothetical protein
MTIKPSRRTEPDSSKIVHLFDTRHLVTNPRDVNQGTLLYFTYGSSLP